MYTYHVAYFSVVMETLSSPSSLRKLRGISCHVIKMADCSEGSSEGGLLTEGISLTLDSLNNASLLVLKQDEATMKQIDSIQKEVRYVYRFDHDSSGNSIYDFR